MKPRNQKFMVAYVGNANDPNTFGGLPHHLVEVGKTSGLVEAGLSFRTSRSSLKLARYLWNAEQCLRTFKFGGFQYSEVFLRKLWASAPEPRGNSPILNLFQLFPKREMQIGYAKYFYLDQALLDVFDYYGNGAAISDSWRSNILSRERQQYLAADKVILRSHWAAERVKVNYNLPNSKVAVVLPGANISQAALAAFDGLGRTSNEGSPELRLVFVGKDWFRKGLDRLLRAMRLAKAEGARISLTVIGVRPNKILQELAQGLSINWVGYLDKSGDPMGFACLVARHDIGVLLSRSEAGGLSLREFGRLGLPVIGPNTGGSPEFAMSDTAQLFAPESPDEAIAEALINHAADRRNLESLKRDAWEKRHAFDWTAAVKHLCCIL